MLPNSAKPLFWALALSAPALAQFTYPGCAAMAGSDFTVTTLVSNATDNTLREPTKMALVQNDQGNTDVYFVQRYGAVRKYDGTTRTLSTVANFAFSTGTSQSAADTNQVHSSSSEGLQGIALDPDFRSNGWVYLYFSMKSVWRITRYTLSGSTLNLGTAKTIVRFTHPSFAQHMGSALRFDAEGNLWVTVADNGGTNWPDDRNVHYQAANTSKYFGKILRVKPKPIPDNQTAPPPGPGSTYDIPAGNLRQKFFEIGGAWVAGQDTNKILPEIYVMGTRNPYTITIDTVRKAVAWGDVGPDSYGTTSPESLWTEEFNFTTQPGNFGWPMWAGKRTPMPSGGWAGFTGSAQQPPPGGFGPMSSPTYSRPDSATGIVRLPPAQPAMINYGKACAVSGPVYYYNGSSNSTVKFPPHLNGAWFIADFNTSWINAVELNPAGTAVVSIKKMFSYSAGGSPALSPAAASGNSLRQIPSANMNSSNSLLDLQMGPDGALYIMNYSGYRTYDSKAGIVRITYNGTCLPTTPIFANAPHAPVRDLLRVKGTDVSVLVSGLHSLEARDLRGKRVALRKGSGPANYSLDELNRRGVYLLALSSSEGNQVRKIVRE